jgi:hypothetical protein
MGERIASVALEEEPIRHPRCEKERKAEQAVEDRVFTHRASDSRTTALAVGLSSSLARIQRFRHTFLVDTVDGPSRAASPEVFSFHLLRLPLAQVPRFLYGGLSAPGLRHAESFFTMTLGEPVLSARRYQFRDVATFAHWEDETALDGMLAQPRGRPFAEGWHVRIASLSSLGAHLRNRKRASRQRRSATGPARGRGDPLARLRPQETLRFARFGKPVERQVRDHDGKTLALAAMRPLTTFCTFSVWRDEAAMAGMVHGRTSDKDGTSHALAMRERTRKDFHHEFTTLRMIPLREVGEWNGKSGYTAMSAP